MRTLELALLAPIMMVLMALAAVVIWWSAAQGEATLASQEAAQAAATGASLASVQALLGSSYTLRVTTSAGGEVARVVGPSLSVGGFGFHVRASAWAPDESMVRPA